MLNGSQNPMNISGHMGMPGGLPPNFMMSNGMMPNGMPPNAQMMPYIYMSPQLQQQQQQLQRNHENHKK
jgi:hypothetical protein